MLMGMALAALTAAQAAAPQTGSGPQWVPLKGSAQEKLQQQAPAQSVPVATGTARSPETLTNETVISLVRAGGGPGTKGAQNGGAPRANHTGPPAGGAGRELGSLNRWGVVWQHYV